MNVLGEPGASPLEVEGMVSSAAGALLGVAEAAAGDVGSGAGVGVVCAPALDVKKGRSRDAAIPASAASRSQRRRFGEDGKKLCSMTLSFLCG
jgi:hypothetical protein